MLKKKYHYLKKKALKTYLKLILKKILLYQKNIRF